MLEVDLSNITKDIIVNFTLIAYEIKKINYIYLTFLIIEKIVIFAYNCDRRKYVTTH